MSDPAPSDPHEQRIAELRRRRRARLRWLAVRGSLAAAALTLLLAAFVYWLLTTVGGRDLLLAQIVARLPADASLAWRAAEGPVSGPLTLHDVRFRYRDTAFAARRVHLDPALMPLLGRRLRLDALQVEGATLTLPRSEDEPFELPRWPEVLPEIAPPLELQADDVRVDGFVLVREGERLLEVRRLRAGLDAQNGRLRIARLDMDSDRGRFAAHGVYAPREDYHTDLTATAVLPAAAGRTPARLGLVARGDLARMDVAVAGRAPEPLQATLTLRGRDDPRWHLRARADALDPTLLTGADADGAPPIALDFRADGVGGAADLGGRFARGDLRAEVRPSKVRLENQVLEVQPLALALLDGTATLRGRADFTDPANARFRFAVNARGLQWRGAAPAPVAADADLGVAGTLQAWAAIGRAELRRERDRAELRFDARGDDARATLKSLQARMPSGRLDAEGSLAWAPALGWDARATLAGFDPGYFAPDWKGAIDGRLSSTGRTRSDGGLEIVADAADLGGRLRGRPLRGRAHFAMHGAARPADLDAYEGDAALGLGASRIEARGKLARELDVDARFEPLVLADLLPQGAGSLRGRVQLRGPRDAPDLAADLTGTGLKYADYRVGSLSLRGRLPWRRGGGELALRAGGLEVGVPLASLEADARGAVEALQLQARAQGGIGTLSLAGSAHRRGASWQGTLAALQLQPAKGAAWRLREPAPYAWDGRNGRLGESCLAASDGGALCASADWPRRGVALRGQGLPLALLAPYLPEREHGLPWLLRGEIALTAQLRPLGNGWRGQLDLESAEGGMRNSQRARRELLSYQGLRLHASFDPRRINAEFGTGFNGGGRIDARLSGGWDAYAPMAGELSFATDELTWIELFSPDIVEPKGRLEGRLRLAGTPARPQLGGQARLSQFATELPSLAIALEDGDLRLDARDDGSARIVGSVRSGEGTLAIDGALDWRNQDAPLLIGLRGRNVLVSDTRDLRAVASPDLQLRYKAGEPLQLTGTVAVPSARIDLERLDQGVSASEDVVVLDPADPDEGGSTALELDLTLQVGDDVRLNGFGLDGSLAGQLHVRARPGRETTASGKLEVEGRYKAYGQQLDITRGALAWSGGPVDDPILDVRAQRVVGDVTAGVDISGRASAPKAEVWSDPASSQSEALAYLTLGRPLSTLSGDESRQLNAASAALSAGGSLIASQLGARLGLEDAGVSESRALGGSVLGFGKRISPRLYVGYGVSLLGTGQVLMLKYLLRKGFDIQIESSTVENRASINWRKEK